jgi:putative ABC transport system permease protein
MSTVDISWYGLALGYALLILPLGILLWARVPIVGKTLIALIRMTVQLLFVGFYLVVVFDLGSPWLNAAWLLVMITVADVSVVRGCGIKLAPFVVPLFLSLLVGTAVPLLLSLAPAVGSSRILKAQYLIPLSGMILGNCLRADIIGIRVFYEGIRNREKPYLLQLSQGASLKEAAMPYLREAFHSALAPTIATMATAGLVSLPGMMTGVILGGADPLTAIKYQILIMVSIFSGTALTVALAIRLTLRGAFNEYGVLNRRIFKQ